MLDTGTADVTVRNERAAQTRNAADGMRVANLGSSIFGQEPIARISGNRKSPLIVWAIVTTSAVFLLGAIIGTPLAQASGHLAIASAIYKTFSLVCHQIPERSFHLLGYKFAVCSRCTGIYAGFALAAFSYPLVRSLKQGETPSLIWLFLAAAPLGIDWALGYFSIWQNNQASRFSTGALLGATAVFYILPGLIELSGRLGPGGVPAGSDANNLYQG